MLALAMTFAACWGVLQLAILGSLTLVAITLVGGLACGVVAATLRSRVRGERGVVGDGDGTN